MHTYGRALWTDGRPANCLHVWMRVSEIDDGAHYKQRMHAGIHNNDNKYYRNEEKKKTAEKTKIFLDFN